MTQSGKTTQSQEPSTAKKRKLLRKKPQANIVSESHIESGDSEIENPVTVARPPRRCKEKADKPLSKKKLQQLHQETERLIRNNKATLEPKVAKKLSLRDFVNKFSSTVDRVETGVPAQPIGVNVENAVPNVGSAGTQNGTPKDDGLSLRKLEKQRAAEHEIIQNILGSDGFTSSSSDEYELEITYETGVSRTTRESNGTRSGPMTPGRATATRNVPKILPTHHFGKKSPITLKTLNAILAERMKAERLERKAEMLENAKNAGIDVNEWKMHSEERVQWETEFEAKARMNILVEEGSGDGVGEREEGEDGGDGDEEEDEGEYVYSGSEEGEDEEEEKDNSQSSSQPSDQDNAHDNEDIADEMEEAVESILFPKENDDDDHHGFKQPTAGTSNVYSNAVSEGFEIAIFPKASLGDFFTSSFPATSSNSVKFDNPMDALRNRGAEPTLEGCSPSLSHLSHDVGATEDKDKQRQEDGDASLSIDQGIDQDGFATREASEQDNYSETFSDDDEQVGKSMPQAVNVVNEDGFFEMAPVGQVPMTRKLVRNTHKDISDDGWSEDDKENVDPNTKSRQRGRAKQKRPKSDFVYDQAEESEEEGVVREHRSSDDDDNDSDLDSYVEEDGVVHETDEVVDKNALLQKHEAEMRKEDERLQQEFESGAIFKRRGNFDDDRGFGFGDWDSWGHRRRNAGPGYKRNKPDTREDKLEEIAKNPKTAAFAATIRRTNFVDVDVDDPFGEEETPLNTLANVL